MLFIRTAPLAAVAMLLFVMLNLSAIFPNSGVGPMSALAEKKTDILFVKGKFILKDKKGSIVISDDHHKKCPCHYK